jgi:hypothetical protein
VFLLRGFLAAAQPLRRRRRTEIRGAVTASGTTRARSAEAAATETTTTRTGAAKSAATWARAAESAAGPRTTVSAARWSRAWRPVFPRARFAHREVAPHERLRIELLDDLLGDTALSELDEREAARTSRFAINRHHDVSGCGDRCEVSSEIRFGRAVGEVPYEETDSHYASVRPGDSISGLRQMPNRE